MKDVVRLVLAGDHNVGKSSLVSTFFNERFPTTVDECVGKKEFPAHLSPDHIALEIVDTRSFDTSPTASETEQRKKAETLAALKSAHAVILVYDVEDTTTFDRIDSFWLPWLRQENITNVPVILVGNKVEIRGDSLTQERLESMVVPMMSKYKEVETCLECSAKTMVNVADVFRYAQVAVVHPTRPIYDTDKHALRVECEDALRRVFKIVDRDCDGFLSDDELNDFQRYCFGQPLLEEELMGVKSVVERNVKDGIAKEGMTMAGFVFLHTLFVQRGRMETTWTVLRKFGYDDEKPTLCFHPDYLLPPAYAALSGAAVELSPEALAYLHAVFDAHTRRVGTASLTPSALDELFNVAPNGNPWPQSVWRSAVRTTKDGNITLDGFLSMWNLMVVDDYTKALRFLAYLGFDGREIAPLLVLKSRRKRRARNVITALVVGSQGCGKTTLLSRLVEKDVAAGAALGGYRRVCAMLSVSGSDKFLLLTEVPADEARTVLDDPKHRLIVAADVVVLLFDAGSQASQAFTEDCVRSLTNSPLPVVVAAGKADVKGSEVVLERARKFSAGVGLPAPLELKQGALSADFGSRVVSGATTAADAHLIMSSDRRSEMRRSKVVKGVVAAATVTAVLAAVAIAARYVWRAYRSAPAKQ